MNEKFLPIGTVCTIKGSNSEVMIVGYMQPKLINNKIKFYDYEAYEYPSGTLTINSICLFNHDEITSVKFVGYKDSKYDQLNNTLNGKTSDESVGTFTNIEFDENGVIVYAETKEQNVEIEEPVKYNNVTNPFISKIKSAESEAPVDSKDWSIFNKIEFDENGVIVAAEEK